MTTEKITYVSVLNAVIEGRALTDEEREKLVALRDSVAKRNSTKSGKPTKAQLANEALMNDIIAFMVEGENYSTANLIKGVASLAEIDATSQKVTPLMKKLVENGKVVSEKVKGKVQYHLA